MLLTPTDKVEGESWKETIIDKNEKFKDTHVPAHGEGDSAENLLQSTWHHKVEKLWKSSCSVN